MKWWEICPKYTVRVKKQIAEGYIWYDCIHVFKNVCKYMLVYIFNNSHGYLPEMGLGNEGGV